MFQLDGWVGLDNLADNHVCRVANADEVEEEKDNAQPARVFGEVRLCDFGVAELFRFFVKI